MAGDRSQATMVVNYEVTMATEIAYPHIEKNPGQSARLRRIPRIRVAQIVMDYLAHGWSADEMCRQHSYLRPAEAHAAMGYYFDHQAEIDAEIQQELSDVGESRRPLPDTPFVARLRVQGRL